METVQPLIEIRDLDYTYSGNPPLKALTGINLTCRPGEFVAIVGANGSGKTTLARLLNALLLPTRGEIFVAGLNTRDRATWPLLRSHVAMVFQQPEDQIISTTVEDDVAFGPENLGLPADEVERRVRRALDWVDMWPLRHRPPHLLSVGQQQRVAIAGALAMQPSCLVLDEPTAMLDPAGRKQVLAILKRLQAEGVTILLITHHMPEAAQAERVIVLASGQIAYDGKPETLFSHPERVARLGLEPPPWADLAARLTRYWPDLPTEWPNLPALVNALVSRIPAAGPSVFVDLMPTGNGRPVLAAHHLGHTYLAGTPLAVRALDDISLEIHPGESVALVGATGSGKSTLLQHLAGLLVPQTGQVLIAGQDVHAYRTHRISICRQVGILLQRPEEQLFETYVGDDIAFGPRQLGLDRETVRERVRWAMEMVGLPFLSYKDRFTQSLSGGERRKAALAGVLALRPKTLLLDEPTASLDAQARQDILTILRRLNKEGVTLVIASHNMDDVTALARRVIVLENGRIVLEGPTRRIFSNPGHVQSLGLDVPAAVSIIAALRESGLNVPTDALTLDEVEEALTGHLRYIPVAGRTEN